MLPFDGSEMSPHKVELDEATAKIEKLQAQLEAKTTEVMAPSGRIFFVCAYSTTVGEALESARGGAPIKVGS